MLSLQKFNQIIKIRISLDLNSEITFKQKYLTRTSTKNSKNKPNPNHKVLCVFTNDV